MVHALGGILDGDAFFFALDALHEFLSILVLTGHDVRDAEVGENDRCYAQQIVHLTAHKRLVVPDRIAVPVVLHEEDVTHVQFPGLVLGAELSTLLENLLHLRVVPLVPVHLGLHHEDGNVLVEARVILGQRGIDGFCVAGESGILDSLSFLTKRVNVL